MAKSSKYVVPNINISVISGNLTKDPESFGDEEFAICGLRVAVNRRGVNRETGEYENKPSYINVTVFGPQGEACDRYLQKGSGVAVEGHLQWSTYTAPDGSRREALQIVAHTVQFIGPRPKGAPETLVVDVENISQEMFEGLADLVAERMGEEDR